MTETGWAGTLGTVVTSLFPRKHGPHLLFPDNIPVWFWCLSWHRQHRRAGSTLSDGCLHVTPQPLSRVHVNKVAQLD